MLLSVFCCASSVGDSVHLRDGSLIQGKITSIRDGVVYLKTEYTGDLGIPLVGVSGIATDDAQSVTLKSGAAYKGRLQFVEGRQEVLQNGAPTAIDVNGLAKTEPLPPPEATKRPANWSGRLELSLKADQGNSENVNVAAGVTATRTDELNRLTLMLRSQYEESDGATDKNEAFGQLHYERDHSEMVFFFTRLDLEYDRFESIDLRARVSAGFGRFLVRSPRQDLKVLGGVSYEHERFSDSSTVDTPLGGFGYLYRLSVRDWLRFDSTLISYFNFSDFSDWRVLAENSAEVPVGRGEKWKLRLGVRNELDTDPLPGIEELDTNYYLSIVYAWE